MKAKYIFGIFVLVALLQASAPLKMIYDSESTLRDGVKYKFKTQPIDPTDPFRGKYITLSFDIEDWSAKDTAWVSNEKVYVYIEKDKDGFAKVKEVLHEAGGEGDYFTAEVIYYYDYDKTLRLTFPFNRYYMEEGKALEAEKAYQRHSVRKNTKPAYALVAVKDGNSVLEDVIVDDIPIRDYVLKEREQ